MRATLALNGLRTKVFQQSVIPFYWQKFPQLKGTVMQVEKALINDRLRVSKVS